MIDPADELLVPDTPEDGPIASVVLKLAEAIGGLAVSKGPISPARLKTAISVADAIGKMLNEPSLTRVFTLRALCSPPSYATAVSNLKALQNRTSPERAAFVRELARLGHGAEVAHALAVSLPANRRHEGGIRDSLSVLAERARQFVRNDPELLQAARNFAIDFDQAQLLDATKEAQRTGNLTQLVNPLLMALDEARGQLKTIARAAEEQVETLSAAQDLEAAADQMERIARQRFAAITRRGRMLKRHLRQDLNALIEDATEEFEVDFRRLDERVKGIFGKSDTMDLSNRIVVKNLERRYVILAQKYQDELDLLDREISEFCDEFTSICDEALRPIARHEFHGVVPHPSLELRIKAAVDRATNRTLMAGAVGAAATGAVLHTGLAAGVVLGAAATPVGVIILGAVTLAGVWKAFSDPNERRKRDRRERTQSLENALREQFTTTLPQFEATVDAIIDRFRSTTVDDIRSPRIEAKRIREIASAHRIITRVIVESANKQIDDILSLIHSTGAFTSGIPPVQARTVS